MGSRVLAIVLMAFSASVCGRAQSVLNTLLGSAPDGIQELFATLNDPCSVVSDAGGNVYVAIKGSHQIVRIDNTGIVHLFAGTGSVGSAGDGGQAKLATLTTPAGLTLDSAGNLYIADSDANRIREIAPNGVINTFAGTGKAGYSGDGGPATAARLASPSAIAFDKSGDLLIADTDNNVVRMVAPGGTISTIAGTGISGSSGNGGPALQALLNSPQGIAVDSAGDIFIADTHNLWIRKLTPDGNINRFAGTDPANPPPSGSDTTIATNFTMTFPTSLALDQAGNLYVVEYSAPRVLKITPGDTVSSYAGTGSPGSSGDGGWARFANLNVVGIGMDPHYNLLIADGTSNRVRIVTADGLINTLAGNGLGTYNPRGFVLDGKGDIYFSDGATNRVRLFNPSTGQVTIVAGNGVPGYTGDAGPATEASLNTPRGLALDKSGNLYIADSLNDVIRVVNTAGIITTVVGIGGTATSTGDGFLASEATINTPSSVAFDSSGNLFIAEATGQYIRKVNPSGIINTVAGLGAAGAPSAETGIAIVQELNTPAALVAEPSGSVLIADSGNNRIRRLLTSGTITTVAGSRTAGYSGDGGPATSAQLWAPSGVAEDAAGNIYIADTSNARIRRVGPDGIITTVAGDATRGFTGDGSPATAYALFGPSALIPDSGCSVVISDTENNRVRQLFPAIDYTISSNPAGLQLTVDGQTSVSPVAVSLLPGTQHNVSAPSPQAGPPGTRYLPLGAQAFTVACGAARAAVTLNFDTQYSLTVVTDDGGSVTPAAAWQDAGSAVTLQASANSGYVFAGWLGDCAGAGACQLTMNGPRNVKAAFAPAQFQKGAISSGGVVGGGLSMPPVTTLSPNGVATIFGNSFAPAGTSVVVGPANLIAGSLPTELDGVCVLVGTTQAPLLALTPAQINFQVPQVPVPGTLPVQVVTGCGTAQALQSAPAATPFQSASPEFFYFVHNASGQNPIAALDATTGMLVGSPGLVSGAPFAPAAPGDLVTLYATGLGATNPAFAAGVVPTQAGSITGTFSVSVGSVALAPSSVQYVGASELNAGVYEVRIQLPASTPPGNQPVQITVNGFASPASGYITVGQ